MGICGSVFDDGSSPPAPIPAQDTTEAVFMISRTESKHVHARVRHFSSKLLWKRYKGTMSVLGTGSTGDVRVVRRKKEDGSVGKKFALKSVAKKAIDPTRLSNFKEEVDIMKEIDHPNIVKLHETYEDDDTLYMILDLCDGGELYDMLAAHKKLSEGVASRLVRQMLAAILYCHSKGICHRDLKLENFVFKDANKEVLQLIDFGLSARNVKDKQTRMTKIVGSGTSSVIFVVPVVDRIHNTSRRRTRRSYTQHITLHLRCIALRV